MDLVSSVLKEDVGRSANLPGEFCLIPKGKLRVDESYQRPVHERHVRHIAKNWNWVLCGALTVALRETLYYVIDGQQRLTAALRSSSISTLPCMVFQGVGVGQEAQDFLGVNRNRKSLTKADVFHAALAAREPAALLCHRLMEEQDIVLATWSGQPRSIMAIGTMMYFAETKHTENLEAMWPLVVQTAAGEQIDSRLLKGIMQLCLINGPGMMLSRVVRRKCELVGQQALLKAAAETEVYYRKIAGTTGKSKYAASIFARGFAEAINKNVKSRDKLKYERPDDEE
jgi:hypothetical protein